MLQSIFDGVITAVGDKINDILPDLVTAYRPVAWVFYIGAAAVLFAVPTTEVYRIITDPPPSHIPSWIVYGPSLFFGGMGVAAIIGLAASERDRRARRREQRPSPSTTDDDYVVCPKCQFEQWRHYAACQKCGRHFPT